MWGKHFSEYLPVEIYDRDLNTYSNCDFDNFWEAVLTCCELFGSIAKLVSEKLDYVYNIKEEEGIRAYLTNIKKQSYS
ncbi:MAG: aminoglycoside 6-adenylyltransferase [Clostridium sp.]